MVVYKLLMFCNDYFFRCVRRMKTARRHQVLAGVQGDSSGVVETLVLNHFPCLVGGLWIQAAIFFHDWEIFVSTICLLEYRCRLAAYHCTHGLFAMCATCRELAVKLTGTSSVWGVRVSGPISRPRAFAVCGDRDRPFMLCSTCGFFIDASRACHWAYWGHARLSGAQPSTRLISWVVSTDFMVTFPIVNSAIGRQVPGNWLGGSHDLAELVEVAFMCFEGGLCK